ncbi:MAG: DUF3644 domain-containing protein [Chloroflexota bacterium]
MAKRNRSVGSVKIELLEKSREAALSAIRIYNDPQVTFKSESFIVLMMIAWTYLLHAYYRSKGIEYRYFRQGPKRKIFDRTKHGAYKYWELERCLNNHKSPIDNDTSNNLRFLIGLRHEIEHQMTRSLDAYLSGRYQACAMNYNQYIKKLFGKRFSIDDQLTYSIQFSALSEEQLAGPIPEARIPERLRTYIAEFDGALTHEEYNSPHYAFRMLFKRKLVNHPGQADRVVEFISQDSELAQQIDRQYWVQKQVEKKKYRAKDIVAEVKKAGFPRFNLHGAHTRIWQAEEARDPAKNYGVEVQGTWYWYENWLARVLEICEAAGDQYR